MARNTGRGSRRATDRRNNSGIFAEAKSWGGMLGHRRSWWRRLLGWR